MDRLQLAGPAESVGASGTLSLVTVAEFQAYIGQAAEAAFDALCQTILDSVSQSAFALTGGRFLKRPAASFDFALTPDTDSGEVLFLHQYPIGAVATVEIGHMNGNGTWTVDQALTSADWYAETRAGRLYGTWPSNRHSVRVVWTGGPAAVPADAKEAAMIWAAVKLARRGKGRFDATSTSGPTEGATYEDELPKAARVVFQRYKLSEATLI